MNPDLYACLPPDKKEEYKKMFPEPTIDYAMSAINIADYAPCGYVLLGDQAFRLPDSQTCTSEESKPGDLEEINSHLESLTKSSRINFGEFVDEMSKESMRKQVEEHFEKLLNRSEERELICRLWYGL